MERTWYYQTITDYKILDYLLLDTGLEENFIGSEKQFFKIIYIIWFSDANNRIWCFYLFVCLAKNLTLFRFLYLTVYQQRWAITNSDLFWRQSTYFHEHSSINQAIFFFPCENIWYIGASTPMLIFKNIKTVGSFNNC